MSDLVHDNGIAMDAEAQAIVARAQAIPSGEVAGQGLRSAHVRPTLQALRQFQDAAVNHFGQPVRLFIRFGSDANGCHGASIGPAAAQVKSIDLWPREKSNGEIKRDILYCLGHAPRFQDHLKQLGERPASNSRQQFGKTTQDTSNWESQDAKMSLPSFSAYPVSR